MTTITVSEEKFNKVLADVEMLITDVSSLFEEEEIVKKRLKEIKNNPSIGKSEEEVNTYLKARGVKVD